MAKASKPARSKSIPYLALAVICERALIEKDEVLSAIRIVDQVVVPIAADEPKKGDTLALGLIMLLSFKAGDTSGGQRKMELHLVAPSGKKTHTTQADLHFAANTPEAGYNVRANLMLKYEQEGLYWFEVYVEGTFITKLPFRLTFVRAEAKPGAAPK